MTEEILREDRAVATRDIGQDRARRAGEETSRQRVLDEILVSFRIPSRNKIEFPVFATTPPASMMCGVADSRAQNLVSRNFALLPTYRWF
jgi:hypothetical protein